MKKIAVAIFAMAIFSIMISCNQAPVQQPKTSVYLISEGGGNDTIKTVAKSYERTITDSLGVMHHSGKTTTTAVVKKDPSQLKLVVTDMPQNQPIQQQAQPVTTTQSHISDWGMIAMILAIAALLGLFCYFLFHRNTSAYASANATVVNIPRGGNIEDATIIDIINQRQAFRNNTLALAYKGVKKGTLKGIFIDETPLSFTFGANFRDGRNIPSKKPKPHDEIK